MRQNAPRSATPTPDLRLTQQSGSVNRSLMESLSSSVAPGHSATIHKKGNKPSSTVWRNSLNSQETLMDTSETQTNMQNSYVHTKCETQSNAEKLLSHSHLSNFKMCVNQHEMKTRTQSDLSSLKKGDHQLLEQLKENVCSDHQNNHNEGYPTQRLMNKVDGNMRIYGEHPSDHKKRECGIKEICHKSPGINLDDVPISEAQVLLRLNEKKMAEAGSQEELMETEEYQMSMDSDAKDLLRRNELAFARRQTLSSCRDKLEVSQPKNLLYPSCIVDQIGLNVCSSGERINPTVYQVKRPAALLYPSHNINTEERHQAVVTEYNNREYMPHFHGDYYAHQLCVKEPSKDFQDHFVGKTTRDSFDILDYLDKDIIVHRPRRTIVIEATPDSDGSPVWSAAEDAFIPRNPLRRGINDLAFKMLPRHQF
ncbi:hypothetical protein CHS0354_020167 [Potamilus streckersoni]|uniref:Uncharacterized protein n=1 Tax=Potamilus streckersoni TaxID=2493646 RepID=A0AAE0S528_9BIVA|nr:hypothetical protein CHS0354_020167 [Potamilus streckersoni]